MIEYAGSNNKELRQARQEAIDYYQELEQIPISWELNTQEVSDLNFKGYEAKRKASEVTGQERLYYDRNEPFEQNIPFWKRYNVKLSVDVPTYYIIPQAYGDVAEKLRLNGVELTRSKRDSFATSTSYRITHVESRKSPYEGHYLHDKIEVEKEIIEFQVRAGDYVVATDQPARRYICETLEPHAPDSYFAWNFFDGILMQKEYFSPYVFEDEAARLLQSDAALKKAFEEKKATDAEFEKSSYAQLEYIYKASPHYESTHNLYPVGRIFK